MYSSGNSAIIRSQRCQSMLRTDQILWKTEDSVRTAVNGTMEGELKIQMERKGIKHGIWKVWVLYT